MNVIPLRLEDRIPGDTPDTSWKSKLISRQTKAGAVVKPLTTRIVTDPVSVRTAAAADAAYLMSLLRLPPGASSPEANAR